MSAEEQELGVLHDNMQKIYTAGEYLLGLINDTLDIQKMDSGNLKLNPGIVYGERIFTETGALVKELLLKRDVRFAVETQDARLDRYIYTDLMRSKQIILNLVTNAIKFTPDGGNVFLSCRCTEIDDAMLQEEIIVKDSGIGMSQEFIKNGLFQPFSQEHSEIVSNNAGTGLGLSIVKHLVEMMEGTIAVESTIGKGITFTIRMAYPLVDRETVKREQEKQNQLNRHDGTSLNGKQILLAEDHPLNAEIATKLLEKQGCKVIWAKDGKECVDIFAHSKRNQFDVILMDIRMPNMDGNEAAKEIRACKREDAKAIPIIAMTANAFEEDRQKSMDAGMNAHLSKPIDPTTLYQVIVDSIEIQASEE